MQLAMGAKILSANNIEHHKELNAIRGSHLIINKRIKNPLVLQNDEDSRIVFLLPQENMTILGTTEVKQDLDEVVECKDYEKGYLIRTANKYLKEKISSKDVINDYSGIRPVILDQKY